MAYQALEPVSKQLTIVIGLIVVGFMAFGLALSFYRNVLFEETLEDIRVQNEKLQEGIAQGHRDLDYYRSTQYKDKYAKENLGKVKPGEKLLIIAQLPQSPVPTEDEAAAIERRRQERLEDMLRQMPVTEHWQLYLFDRTRLEQLKNSL
jgi:cell division protein FtsB